MRIQTNIKSLATGSLKIAAGVLVALALLTGVALLSGPVSAQEVWVERDKVVAALAKQYAEAPMALGITTEGAVIELFRAGNGATWTLVVTMPNGLSRIVASGEAWTKVPLQVKGRIS